MARVSDADVKTILDTTVTTTPFITMANLFVNNRLVGQGLDEDMLTQIELNVSAHLTCMLDPRLTQEAMGDLKRTMQDGPLAQGLASTRYGQTAIMLDPTGILASASVKIPATFNVD